MLHGNPPTHLKRSNGPPTFRVVRQQSGPRIGANKVTCTRARGASKTLGLSGGMGRKKISRRCANIRDKWIISSRDSVDSQRTRAGRYILVAGARPIRGSSLSSSLTPPHFLICVTSSFFCKLPLIPLRTTNFMLEGLDWLLGCRETSKNRISVAGVSLSECLSRGVFQK